MARFWDVQSGSVRLGGQILNTYEVDNYLGLPGISGFDMGMTFRQHAEKLGAEFLEATVHLSLIHI